MASYHAKIGWKRPRKRKNINYRSLPFPTQRVRGNSKKIQKKFEKLNNTIMASFQAKIGWKRPRKRKNINYRSVPFRSVPTQRVTENYKKIANKIQKTKKYYYGFISSQNRLEKAEKEKK